jgi:hypothetical protein
MTEDLSPLQRIVLAFVAFFAVLFRREFAIAVRDLREKHHAVLPPSEPTAKAAPTGAHVAIPRPVTPAPAPPPAAPAARATVEAERAPDPRPALVLLSTLQREGRLVDFIEEDLTGFSDSEVGAAARTVHAGCKRAIESWFRLEPVYAQPEGAAIIVERGFDPTAVRLTGNVVGEPPFRGALRHHGWKARDVKVPWPSDGRDPNIVAPAEVEL